ncbi:MAG TPA: tungstate ABC transporter substrate-binding protein WtpA [Bacteroidales bacterium]|nr:tungstate ABC transporter substrate-binding protein WtpA [Bacteroidales bacterium]
MTRQFALLLLIFLFFSCKNTDKTNQSTAPQGDLIIFHAGSLSVPFKLIAKEFEKENPGTKVLLEAAGSVACARKITDLKKECDIMASADIEVIDRFLIPNFAEWNISFASNEMIIAFTDKSRLSNEINSTNWYKILSNPKVIYGRADPNADPCGYRSVMTTKLTAMIEENSEILKLLEKDNNFIRPKEVDLLGLLEANAIDYIFIYKSVAIQHQLKFISLGDSINLSNPELENWYAQSVVEISGSKPGDFVQLKGSTMLYGITQLKNAPNPLLAKAFLEFFFNSENGMRIIQEQGQENIIPTFSNTYKQIPDYLKKFATDFKQ